MAERPAEVDTLTDEERDVLSTALVARGDVYGAAAQIASARVAAVVRAVERELDDADQVTDTLRKPNRIAVWGVRRALMPFGGEPHRWPVPAEFCAECGHHTYGHQMTREIQDNPEEIAELERSRAQAERGEIRWLDEREHEGEGEGVAGS